jgi:hypothetical protein
VDALGRGRGLNGYENSNPGFDFNAWRSCFRGPVDLDNDVESEESETKVAICLYRDTLCFPMKYLPITGLNEFTTPFL